MRRIVLCLLIGAAVVAPSAATPARPAGCSEGNAKALFQQQPRAFGLRMRGVEAPQIVDSLRHCQYRIFRDGMTFTFSEDDVILAGVVWLYDYPNYDISRAQAIAELDAIEDRLWIDGVEQTLERTTYKEVMDPVFGKSVFQHRAAMLRLEPGVHTSVYESFDPLLGLSTATVTLVVLPS